MPLWQARYAVWKVSSINKFMAEETLHTDFHTTLRRIQLSNAYQLRRVYSVQHADTQPTHQAVNNHMLIPSHHVQAIKPSYPCTVLYIAVASRSNITSLYINTHHTKQLTITCRQVVITSKQLTSYSTLLSYQAVDHHILILCYHIQAVNPHILIRCYHIEQLIITSLYVTITFRSEPSHSYMF